MIDHRCKAIRDKKCKNDDAATEFEIKKKELMNTLADQREKEKERQHLQRRQDKITGAYEEEKEKKVIQEEKLDTKNQKLSEIDDYDR